MPRILVSASFPETLFARQTPHSTGHWEDFEFVFSPSEQAVDGWVVYDNLREPLQQLCPPQNTLLITGEPESIRRYRSRFTSQFASVWTSQPNIQHPQLVRRNEAQHWHYAMRNSAAHGEPLDFDGLQALQPPQKSKLISVICSNKTSTPDHRERLEFVSLLKSTFGQAIDFLGRGFLPVEDKADAIWPYRYHIVLENDHTEHFMTEKISDAFLGWSYPIYFGGPEAYHRFPEGSFTAINIYEPQRAVEIIRSVMAGNTYEESLPQIAAARTAVLNRNNIMAMLAEYWRDNLQIGRAEPIHLLPKSHRTSLVWNQMRRLTRRRFRSRAA
ncbi:MAG: glycosyltransferase family 10 [Pirellulaceae bacterium]